LIKEMIKKHRDPKMEDMILVTPKNRRTLEKRYGIEIPNDVEYILPPAILEELMETPEAWEEVKSDH
jgi:hypothetical protein